MNTRKVALTAAISLLAMAVLAPFAQFGVLQTLIVPADAAATARNFAASAGLFAAAIAAFFVVAVLDVVVAWATYRLFRPIDASRARFVGWARVAYAAGFAYALTNLVHAAQLAGGIPAGGSPTTTVAAQVAASVASFQTTWDLSLLVFGLHLVGLGTLVARSVDFPRLLGALVGVAGAGYLVDAAGRMFIGGYSLTVSQITFIGEALLIVWLFKLATRGPRPVADGRDDGPPIPASFSAVRLGEVDARQVTVRSPRRFGFVRTATRTGRSPVVAIALSILVGAALAVVSLLLTANDGSEPMVTGSVLVAFGLGWALMAYLTGRYSAQPQPWLYVPAAALGGVGLVLVLLQPGSFLMDALGWIWPMALAVLGVWMFIQLRRELRGAGRWLVGALIVVLLLIAVAGGLTTVGAATAAQPAASGQLVDVGGRKLYLQCQGSGGPVVILQAGLGGTSASWARIQPAIAATTTVCSYDRAGHGRSDDAPSPQDGNAIATDLHDLLVKAGIAGPYVLVAHSSGGPYARVYTATYPNDVVGMVLLDPQPADAFTSLPDYKATYDYLRLAGGIAPSLARIGLLGPLFGVSPNDATAAIARSQRDEFRALPAALSQAAKVTSIGDRPLIIVSAGVEGQRGWAAAQSAQVSLSTNVAHRVVADGTHDSVIEGDDAPTSAQAILDVLAAVRDGTPLS